MRLLVKYSDQGKKLSSGALRPYLAFLTTDVRQNADDESLAASKAGQCPRACPALLVALRLFNV